MNSKWYPLDPDYRRTPPNDKPYCCRCQKPVDINKAIKVELNTDFTQFKINPKGAYFIGVDCYKKQTK